jgi:hypothetical protein
MWPEYRKERAGNLKRVGSAFKKAETRWGAISGMDGKTGRVAAETSSIGIMGL